MMTTTMILKAVPFAILLRSCTAVIVSDGSPCYTKCGNVPQSTTDDMVVCDVGAYSSTSAGQVFQACVSCESTSSYGTTKGNSQVSDLQYMLYNMRYTLSKCLVDSGTQCATERSCGLLADSIKTGNLSASVPAYSYCATWSDFQLDECQQCLRSLGGNEYVSNYLSVLSGACRLQLPPPAVLPIDGNIFSADHVNITDPSPTGTFDDSPKGPLSNGQIAGVAVGGVVVILTLLGCGVVLNGKRRRKAYLRRRGALDKKYPPGQAGGNGGEMFETPISQKPLRAWQDSPTSAATQTNFPPYFSPYVSQYNSPVSAIDGGPARNAWPVQAADSIGVAVSPDHDDPVMHWGDVKGKAKLDADTDGYELQEGVSSAGGHGSNLPPPPPLPTEAPTLSHPGYGRRGPPTPP